MKGGKKESSFARFAPNRCENEDARWQKATLIFGGGKGGNDRSRRRRIEEKLYEMIDSRPKVVALKQSGQNHGIIMISWYIRGVSNDLRISASLYE